MAKNQRRKTRKSSSFSKKPVTHLLDAGSFESIRDAKRLTAEHLKFQWMNYAELAGQRSLINDDVTQALTQTCIPYQANKWQRAVKYKYGLHPFSTMGSLTYIGSRFNTGSGVNPEVPSFPALYLAQDKDTALQEHLGQQSSKANSKLNPRELALTNPASETIVSVSCKFDKIFDLTNPKSLNPFVSLIKNFKFSKELITLAGKLNLPPPKIIKTANTLLKTLLDPNWRDVASNCDVPSNPQIFGHLIYSAGIEGILYPSKFTNKLCLVVFPRNFVGTDSFVQLDDEPPHPNVPDRIDAFNWRLCEIDVKDIIK